MINPGISEIIYNYTGPPIFWELEIIDDIGAGDLMHESPKFDFKRGLVMPYPSSRYLHPSRNKITHESEDTGMNFEFRRGYYINGSISWEILDSKYSEWLVYLWGLDDLAGYSPVAVEMFSNTTDWDFEVGDMLEYGSRLSARTTAMYENETRPTLHINLPEELPLDHTANKLIAHNIKFEFQSTKRFDNLSDANFPNRYRDTGGAGEE